MGTDNITDYGNYGIPNIAVKRQEHNRNSKRKGQYDIDPSLVLDNGSLRTVIYFSKVRMDDMEDQTPKRKWK